MQALLLSKQHLKQASRKKAFPDAEVALIAALIVHTPFHLSSSSSSSADDSENNRKTSEDMVDDEKTSNLDQPLWARVNTSLTELESLISAGMAHDGAISSVSLPLDLHPVWEKVIELRRFLVERNDTWREADPELATCLKETPYLQTPSPSLLSRGEIELLNSTSKPSSSESHPSYASSSSQLIPPVNAHFQRVAKPKALISALRGLAPGVGATKLITIESLAKCVDSGQQVSALLSEALSVSVTSRLMHLCFILPVITTKGRSPTTKSSSPEKDRLKYDDYGNEEENDDDEDDDVSLHVTSLDTIRSISQTAKKVHSLHFTNVVEVPGLASAFPLRGNLSLSNIAYGRYLCESVTTNSSSSLSSSSSEREAAYASVLAYAREGWSVSGPAALITERNESTKSLSQRLSALAALSVMINAEWMRHSLTATSVAQTLPVDGNAAGLFAISAQALAFGFRHRHPMEGLKACSRGSLVLFRRAYRSLYRHLASTLSSIALHAVPHESRHSSLPSTTSALVKENNDDSAVELFAKVALRSLIDALDVTWTPKDLCCIFTRTASSAFSSHSARPPLASFLSFLDPTLSSSQVEEEQETSKPLSFSTKLKTANNAIVGLSPSSSTPFSTHLLPASNVSVALRMHAISALDVLLYMYSASTAAGNSTPFYESIDFALERSTALSNKEPETMHVDKVKSQHRSSGREGEGGGGDRNVNLSASRLCGVRDVDDVEVDDDPTVEMDSSDPPSSAVSSNSSSMLQMFREGERRHSFVPPPPPPPPPLPLPRLLSHHSSSMPPPSSFSMLLSSLFESNNAEDDEHIDDRLTSHPPPAMSTLSTPVDRISDDVMTSEDCLAPDDVDGGG